MTRLCCRCGTTLTYLQYICPKCGHRVQACNGIGCKQPYSIGKPTEGRYKGDKTYFWWEKSA